MSRGGDRYDDPVVSVLGPLTLRVDGREVPLPGRREGILLAALATELPRPVGVDTLVDLLWGDTPPRTAEKTLQTYLSRLRRVPGGLAIDRVERSYLLRLDDDCVDVVRFRRMVVGAADLDPHARRDRLADALALWRADQPADLGDTIAATTRSAALVEERLSAIEARIESDLELGRASEVVAELQTLTSAHPYRERLWASLMVALYRTGRRPDALEAYQRARERLGEDRGLDPSPHLKDLERRIIAHDPDLEPTLSIAATGQTPPSGGGEAPRVRTFLFTDVEGSTPLWESETEGMAEAIAQHHRIVTEAATARGGHVFSTAGDSFAVAFDRPGDAVEAVVAIQTLLEDVAWPTTRPLRIRAGLHAGVAIERDGDFFGPVVNEAARVMAVGHGGQVLVTEAVRQLCPAASTEPLGVFELRGVQRSVEIHQLLIDGLPHDFPPLRAIPSTTHRWVASDAPLIGRDREVTDVLTALEDSGAVTLIGPGGVGKTTLAHRIATEVRSERRVVLAELLGDDAAAVPFVVAAAAGFAVPTGADPITHLVTSFGADRALLVLDNCEHVLASVRALADAVATRCPETWLLSTSREPLGIGAEHVVDVAPLAVGGGHSPAVELLIARATEVDPSFSSTGQLDALSRICHQLDGLPLAIELAAARLRAISAVDLADRLEERLWLIDSERTEHGRPRSLRATIEWSHELLDGRDRTVFRRLAPVVGPFSLATGERLAGDSELHPIDVTESILSLTDQSLLAADGGRFRFLDTIRSYAEDQLRQAGEEGAWRHRHADLVAERVETLETIRRGREEHRAVADFDDLTDDLRAAVRWTSRTGDAETLDRLVGASVWFAYWGLRGDLFDLYRAVVDDLDATSVSVGHRALGAVALGSLHRGELEAAEQFSLRSWDAAEAAGGPGSELGAFSMIHVSIRRANFDSVSEWASRLRGIGPDTYASEVWQVMSQAAAGYAGDRESALLRLDDLDSRGLGDEVAPTEAALMDFTRGELLSEVDPLAALEPLQAAVKAADDVDNHLVHGAASVTLASLAARSDNTSVALSTFAALLDYWADRHAVTHAWTVLRNLTELLARTGHDLEALVLHHAAESSETAPAVFGAQRERTETLVEELKRSIDDQTAEHAAHRGQTFSDTDVFEYATEAIARALKA